MEHELKLEDYLEIRSAMMLTLAQDRNLCSADEKTGEMIIDLTLLKQEQDWPDLATMIREATPIPKEYIQLLRGYNPNCYLDV